MITKKRFIVDLLDDDNNNETEQFIRKYGADEITGMINGDVIKAIFPDAICIQKDTFVYIYKNKKKFELKVYLTKVSKKWWNAPYSGGGKE